jgi:hypothetical protein
VKLMDMKSKNSVFILCFKNIYFFKLFQWRTMSLLFGTSLLMTMI